MRKKSANSSIDVDNVDIFMLFTINNKFISIQMKRTGLKMSSVSMKT